MKTPAKIKLYFWQKTSDKNKVMILYENQSPSDISPTTLHDWRIYYTCEVYNPLIPPYPHGTQLFRARHSDKYPYELLDIVPVLDIYSVRDPGTYFVANTSPIDGTEKVPFERIFVYVENVEKYPVPTQIVWHY
jgi:hypothetical protein